ncbi:MAG TPA: hypothetical protein VFP67_12265 [Acidimicrobiia bacterium]|jgi:hypothetical protein|nr:hypothetical protein [Acidimicrobiia bacterium]
MFEAVEFTEVRGQEEPDERVIDAFPDEMSAVEAVRAERASFVETGSEDYVWWVVRQPGERLAQFIADSKSDKEFVLDLATGQLVEV